jgi:hypothetical protein
MVQRGEKLSKITMPGEDRVGAQHWIFLFKPARSVWRFKRDWLSSREVGFEPHIERRGEGSRAGPA